MLYRKYESMIKNGAKLAVVGLALSLSSCATYYNNDRKPSSVEDGVSGTLKDPDTDGREPGSGPRAEASWLDDVSDEFNRVANENSNRTVASEGKNEILLKRKNWSFNYQPKANQFYVDINGELHKVSQNMVNDERRFSFSEEGESKNPLTFSVAKNLGRGVASGLTCVTEISYWKPESSKYVTESVKLKGKNCDTLISKLKDYAP